MGLPLRQITDRFFDNVTVTFRDWHMAYTGKLQHELPFNLQNRTFRLASAATRETWVVVMHSLITPLTELLVLISRNHKLFRAPRWVILAITKHSLLGMASNSIKRTR
ncbi:hypothetical protein F5884DRAFT_862925 [Xylogone sp. PMI_703]|nr:hypothetical protein F5884DRAFT_862925 [Xylogone sp. PMI_703]